MLLLLQQGLPQLVLATSRMPQISIILCHRVEVVLKCNWEASVAALGVKQRRSITALNPEIDRFHFKLSRVVIFLRLLRSI